MLNDLRVQLKGKIYTAAFAAAGAAAVGTAGGLGICLAANMPAVIKSVCLCCCFLIIYHHRHARVHECPLPSLPLLHCKNTHWSRQNSFFFFFFFFGGGGGGGGFVCFTLCLLLSLLGLQGAVHLCFFVLFSGFH